MDVKEKLKENKVFFDALAPLVTGAATLFLAFLTFNLQQEQNDLQKREFLPQFVVESTLSTSTPIVEVIQIYHRGGGYNAFSAQTLSQYEVTLPTKFENVVRPIILPVDDYFAPHFFRTYTDLGQSQSDGLIDTITSTTTAYENVLALQQSYNKDISPGEYKSIWFESYLMIAYSDIFGKRHVEYYFVFPNFSYKIPLETGKEIFARRFELYDSSVSSLDDLDKVVQTAKEQKTPSLIQRVLENIERGKSEYKAREYYLQRTGCTLENLMECDPSGPG